jgi:hypothetical protein
MLLCNKYLSKSFFPDDFRSSVLHFSVLPNRVEGAHRFPLSACLFTACLYTENGMVSRLALTGIGFLNKKEGGKGGANRSSLLR